MPEGTRITTNHQSLSLNTMLAKLFSFLKIKSAHIHADTQEISHELINHEVNNNWTKYQNRKAEDIMIPRVDIVALDYNNSLEEISKIFLKTRHTRMPVYKNGLDDIVGFINIKDILPFILNPKDNQDFQIDKVLRKLLIISPSMKIFNLLEKMRQTRIHIALVVDELGGADGLITIEDLIEEIVGEIEDEHDQINDNLQFKKIDDKTFEVSGRIEIETLEEKLNIRLSSEEFDEDYDTLGGLILSISSYVPNKGDKVIHPTSNIIFEIIDSDPRRIKTVLLHLPA